MSGMPENLNVELLKGMSHGITEREFEGLADASLHELERALNDVDGIEVDLQSGIITIEFEGGLKYIVNSHRAARQIWMAAESSAWHFDYKAGPWIAEKTDDELWATVEGVVSRKLGRPVTLTRS
jgi:CyaY protein